MISIRILERRGRMVTIVGFSTRGSWVRILAKARRGICEQESLKSWVRILAKARRGICEQESLKSTDFKDSCSLLIEKTTPLFSQNPGYRAFDQCAPWARTVACSQSQVLIEDIDTLQPTCSCFTSWFRMKTHPIPINYQDNNNLHALVEGMNR
jgi:hypothetical protein